MCLLINPLQIFVEGKYWWEKTAAVTHTAVMDTTTSTHAIYMFDVEVYNPQREKIFLSHQRDRKRWKKWKDDEGWWRMINAFKICEMYVYICWVSFWVNVQRDVSLWAMLYNLSFPKLYFLIMFEDISHLEDFLLQWKYKLCA